MTRIERIAQLAALFDQNEEIVRRMEAPLLNALIHGTWMWPMLTALHSFPIMYPTANDYCRLQTKTAAWCPTP